MADNMTAIFSPSCLNDAPPGAVVATMRPQDFLRLASPIPTRIDSGQRLKAIQDVLDANLSLDSLPCFELEVCGNDAHVTCHDGRHRAMELLNRGHQTIPVLLYTDESSWNGDAAALAAFLRQPTTAILAQTADEDEEYNLDMDELDERAEPLPAPEVFSSLMTLDVASGLLAPPVPVAMAVGP